MGYSFANFSENVTRIFDPSPKTVATQNHLKETVFAGIAGFSSSDKFSDDAAKQLLEKHFEARFKDIPPDQIPKNFSDEEKKILTAEILGDHFDTVPAEAKEYLLDLVDDVLSDKYEDAWYVSAGKWARDTAAPAITSGVNTVVATFPPTAIGVEALGAASSALTSYAPGAKNIPVIGSILNTTTEYKDTLREKRSDVVDATKSAATSVANFSKFAFQENPERAGELARQGVVNAFVSIGGLAYDTVRFLAYDVQRVTYGNLGVMANNLFADESNRKDWIGTGAFFRGSEWLNEKTQFVDRIRPFNADGTVNKNANYERVLLYGPQAATDAVVIVTLGAVSGGTAGAAYGAARATGTAAARIGTSLNTAMQWSARAFQATNPLATTAGATTTGLMTTFVFAQGVNTDNKIAERDIKQGQETENKLSEDTGVSPDALDQEINDIYESIGMKPENTTDFFNKAAPRPDDASQGSYSSQFNGGAAQPIMIKMDSDALRKIIESHQETRTVPQTNLESSSAVPRIISPVSGAQ